MVWCRVGERWRWAESRKAEGFCPWGRAAGRLSGRLSEGGGVEALGKALLEPSHQPNLPFQLPAGPEGWGDDRQGLAGSSCFSSQN